MLRTFTSDSSRPALDVVNIIAGVALVLSPWFLGYAAEAPAAWHAWIAGAVVVLIAAGALLAFHAYEEWANLVVGLWTVAAPWVIGFSAVATGPSVTFTALARMSTPRSIFSRASVLNLTSLAAIGSLLQIGSFR